MKNLYKLLAAFIVFSFIGCEKLLDRPPMTVLSDETAWVSENNVRLYANKYYTDFFVGYGSGFTTTGAPLGDFTTSDDVLALGTQNNITRAVPNDGIWNYTIIRSVNIMIDRVQNRMSGILDEDQQAHWLGIGRFFRGYRYAQLVFQYGDVPYYDREVFDTEQDELYKLRDPRNFVMDKVYDDLKYAMENVRLNDGAQNLNRYIVAGFITRIALHEGTWQKYYYNNTERAKKFFDLALEAGDLVMNSGRYNITMDYKSQFTSEDLGGKPDVLLYRAYGAEQGVTHSVGTLSNLISSTNLGPTSDLLKSYICVDGKPWNNSTEPNANKFDFASMIATRDSRLEATFFSKPTLLNRASHWYVTKFFSRAAEKATQVDGQDMPTEYTSTNNTTDYPVLRYAEVLLNWIEAKAEAATVGGTAVIQGDIDNTINKIRKRPLAPDAVVRGVKATADLTLSNLPNDPDRDPSVSALLWEIRRERRMEFTFEYSRLADLRRWSKMEYMDTEQNPDLLAGGWVNYPSEFPSVLSDPANTGVLSVVSVTGTQTVFTGSNASVMMGFYRNTTNRERLPFIGQPNLNPYLQPVGRNQINFYSTRGYELKQTEGWY